MIIHPPSLSQVGTDIQVSARIELRSPRRGVPSELWFRFRQGTLPQISTDCDSFAVALLLLGMQNGEPIEIRGSLSRKLFLGLQEYQRIYHSWFPERFKMIEIKPDLLREDQVDAGQGDACAFSGGVDSFYTLLSLLGRGVAAPGPKPTHAVFMAGFDMPLHLSKSIGELTLAYDEMMKTLGIELIIGSTNVRSFVNSVDWTNAHGQALVATALLFKSEWRHFYIPSSYTLKSYPKWGSHPELDFLLSTESLQMVHHGEHANRVKKLEVISKAKESFDRLRVCWIQDLGLKNCGQCEKCIRTMIALDILGALSNYSTFRENTLSRSKVRSLKQRTYQGRLFARELMKEASRRGKFGTCLDLGYSLLRRELFFRGF